MKATKIFHNAHILTVDIANSVASAVAIHGDRILKVGTDKDVLSLADESTIIIDLEQKTLIPGFYDPHGHFLMDSKLQASFANLSPSPVGKGNTFEACFTILKKHIAKTPKGNWVQAYGFDDTMIAEKRFMVRQELDALSSEHPIVILHISGHLAAVNTLALKHLNFDQNTPNPEGGVIRREENNVPNGVLEETAIYPLMYSMLPLSHEEIKDALNKNAYTHASMGVTTTVEAGAVEEGYLRACQENIANKTFPIRIKINAFMQDYDKFTNTEKNDYLDLSGVKIVHDGSIQGYTAYLSEPYHTPNPASGDPEWKGYPTFSEEELYNHIIQYHKAGVQIIVHTNGDQATEDVLNAFEKAQAEHPVFDPRLLLVHAQTAREDQLDRFKKLGVTPTFFAVHTFYWGDRHKSLFLGKERAERQNPIQSAINRGIVCTTHCDTPITPINPLLSMWAAVNRLSSTGELIGEHQRISQVEALRTQTYNAAWQNFQEKETGSIEKGKFADFAVLDMDPTTCTPMKVKDIQVLATYVGGNTVFEKKK